MNITREQFTEALSRITEYLYKSGSPKAIPHEIKLEFSDTVLYELVKDLLFEYVKQDGFLIKDEIKQEMDCLREYIRESDSWEYFIGDKLKLNTIHNDRFIGIYRGMYKGLLEFHTIEGIKQSIPPKDIRYMHRIPDFTYSLMEKGIRILKENNLKAGEKINTRYGEAIVISPYDYSFYWEIKGITDRDLICKVNPMCNGKPIQSDFNFDQGINIEDIIKE